MSVFSDIVQSKFSQCDTSDFSLTHLVLSLLLSANTFSLCVLSVLTYFTRGSAAVPAYCSHLLSKQRSLYECVCMCASFLTVGLVLIVSLTRDTFCHQLPQAELRLAESEFGLLGRDGHTTFVMDLLQCHFFLLLVCDGLVVTAGTNYGFILRIRRDS